MALDCPHSVETWLWMKLKQKLLKIKQGPEEGGLHTPARAETSAAGGSC